jgi:hypothetical protein
MTLYAGDRSPKAIRFTLATGDVTGTDVDSVTLRVRSPSGAESTVSPAFTATATSVSMTWTLEADGSSLPVAGTYWVRAWLYDDGPALLLDSDEQSFQVAAARHSWPT